VAYNEAHGITPQTVVRKMEDITEQMESEHSKAVNANLVLDEEIFQKDPKKLLKLKSQEMDEAVRVLDFETAAILRDEIRFLEEKLAPKKTRKK
jgi:excinuclease ABC subunit B